MISCEEFILAYNELFIFLHKKHGKKSVIEFWKYVADIFLSKLDKLVKEKGIAGMSEYWIRTLTEERAKYKMKVKHGYFEIFMKRCPSVGILNKRKSKKYPYYCEHCEVLYKRVIEKYGFECKIEFIDTNQGICKLKVK